MAKAYLERATPLPSMYHWLIKLVILIIFYCLKVLEAAINLYLIYTTSTTTLTRETGMDILYKPQKAYWVFTLEGNEKSFEMAAVFKIVGCYRIGSMILETVTCYEVSIFCLAKSYLPRYRLFAFFACQLGSVLRRDKCYRGWFAHPSPKSSSYKDLFTSHWSNVQLGRTHRNSTRTE